MSTVDGEKSKGLHVCVFIHGLWGNPVHLDHISGSLQKAFSEDDLHILVAKRNSGYFTYDGIEVGGERVAQEIEEELEKLGKDGRQVTKFSVVGYSLGGLIARFAIGLLYSKGWFDRIQPVNFTTFATPHLGVRTPLLGWHNTLFNEMGARTLSTSGNQMFMIDSFRDTKRPLLAILADPSTTFMRGLSSFRNRSLYANIVNDRSVPYYTAAISSTDPFSKLDAVTLHYVPDYDDVILDSKNPAPPKKETPTYYEAISTGARNALTRAPIILAVSVLLPIGGLFYFVNSGIQSINSAKRIRLHEEGKSGIDTSTFRMPFMIEDAQRRAGHLLGSLSVAQGEDHLPADHIKHDGASDSAKSGSSETLPTNGYPIKPEPETSSTNGNAIPPTQQSISPTTTNSNGQVAKPKDTFSAKADNADFPTLALTPEQFGIIENLNALGFKKYPVHIQKANHSHAAIVVRMARASFADGHVVSRHWTERFEL